MMCMSGSTEGCEIDASDCSGIADYYCCSAGAVDGCNDNSLFLDFVSECVCLCVFVCCGPIYFLCHSSTPFG